MRTFKKDKMILLHYPFGYSLMQSWIGFFLIIFLILIEYIIIGLILGSRNKSILVFIIGANLISGVLTSLIGYNVLWFPWNHSDDVYFDHKTALLLPFFYSLGITIAIEVLIMALLLRKKYSLIYIFKSVPLANFFSSVVGYLIVYFFALFLLRL